MPDSTPRLVPAVDKAARLLRALAAADRPLGISELSRVVNASKGTVRDVLLTLRHYQLVERDHEARFRLGAGLRVLSSAAVPDLPTLAEPSLRELAEEFGETAILGLAEPPRLVLAAVAQPASDFHVSARAGRSIPLGVGCHGKVLVGKQWIGYDDERYVPGVRGVAAPILDAHGVRIGCVMLVGFKDRLDLRTLRRIGQRVLATSRTLSRRLGASEAVA
jgi:DNA-binding IclR family transcriptional regulator